jgi:hypothetical protein
MSIRRGLEVPDNTLALIWFSRKRSFQGESDLAHEVEIVFDIVGWS